MFTASYEREQYETREWYINNKIILYIYAMQQLYMHSMHARLRRTRYDTMQQRARYIYTWCMYRAAA